MTTTKPSRLAREIADHLANRAVGLEQVGGGYRARQRFAGACGILVLGVIAQVRRNLGNTPADPVERARQSLGGIKPALSIQSREARRMGEHVEAGAYP